MYRKLPLKLRSFVTQLVIARLMRVVDEKSVAGLIEELTKLYPNDEILKTEVISRFWYRKRNGQPLAWKNKILHMSQVFDETLSIINHPAFEILVCTQKALWKAYFMEKRQSNPDIFAYHELLTAAHEEQDEEALQLAAFSFYKLQQLSLKPNLDTLRLLLLAKRCFLSSEARRYNRMLIQNSFDALKREITNIKYEKAIDQLLTRYLER
jgi:hypothetical protein